MLDKQDAVARFSLPNANWIGIVEVIQLDAFKSGMEHAASIKRHWHPSECDGVDALRKLIKQEAEKLEKLP